MGTKRLTYIARRLTDQVVMPDRLDTMVHLPPSLPRLDVVAVKKLLLRFRAVRHLNDLRKKASG